MAIKNKRTSVTPSKETAVEKRLKAQLKEDFENYLQEDDDDEESSDFPSADDATPGDKIGGDDLAGIEDTAGTEGLGGEEEGEEVELSPSQEQWMDQEVDALLEPNLEGHEDELTLDETDDGSMIEEADEFEEIGDGDGDDDENLDIEDSANDIDGDIEGDNAALTDFDDDMGMNDDGEHDLPGDFSAEELNAIIDSPDSYEALGDNLKQKALNLPEDELDLDGDEETFEDDGLMEESEEGGNEDDLMEADIASSLGGLGFDKTDSDTEDTFTKFGEDADFKAIDGDGKAAVSSSVKDAGWEQGSKPKGDTIAEGIKKSKMLVQAAKVILKLQEANKNLKIDNKKLSKVNGILGAVGEKLSKTTRKKISESFAKCKTEKEVDTLYNKVAKVITEKKQPTLNEAVQKRKTTNTKTVINEATKQQEVKKALSSEQQRINYLMGLNGFDDSYFKK